MQWYPWLNYSYNFIIKQYIANRGHHALLIQSLPGMGEERLILEIGRWLMCHGPKKSTSCRKCYSCKLMLSENHPDVYHIKAEKNTNSIGIDKIRNIIEKLYHHSYLGGSKIVFLLDADKLTDSAANSLLKTLEEPSFNTWFFLTIHEPARLLMTVRSRCLVFKIPIPDEGLALKWLKQECSSNQKQCYTALRLSFGAPIEALELLTEPYWGQRLQVCSVLSEALIGDFFNLLPILNHNNVIKRIYWLCSLLLDAAKLQQGAKKCISNIDQVSLIINLSRLLSSDVLDKSLYTWVRCYNRLTTIIGVNHELLLIEQLIYWESLLKK
ncbi:DNA polymerase III subunit delta' [Candidatus Erwinia haradaeae]|uniref:DNA polymerase III subunit delta' n=1 Tax=Candidatus Erwinia haradaeae TaxID=1922217 RepID=A0A451D3C1_9GAMM|nr:DNA polymerase III subunit delta' [Candidatus Erwinia haradaeae]VFP80180.1 DNA polymerase III subunit delta' [Candidatus Erwinia haradaeae]